MGDTLPSNRFRTANEILIPVGRPVVVALGPVFVDVASIVSGYSIQTGVSVNGTLSSDRAVQGDFASRAVEMGHGESADLDHIESRGMLEAADAAAVSGSAKHRGGDQLDREVAIPDRVEAVGPFEIVTHFTRDDRKTDEDSVTERYSLRWRGEEFAFAGAAGWRGDPHADSAIQAAPPPLPPAPSTPDSPATPPPARWVN